MNDKFNIDDSIILDPDTVRSNNIKKILTSIAILVVLFLIILIVMKFINSGDTTHSQPLVMPTEEAIFTPVAEVVKPIEIKPINEQPTDEKQLTTTSDLIGQAQDKVATNQTQVIEEPKSVEVQPKQVETKPETKPAQSKPAETSKPKEVVVVTADKNAPQKAAEPKAETKPEPKPAQSKPAETKVVKKGAELTGNVPSGSYIQVLATSEFKPSNSYIQKLTDQGYSYRLYKTTVNNTEFTKVLVGPYSGDQLQKEMSNIRAVINKDAFVFKIN
ncbi:MAG: SPOR domain-containing protein [Campylobacter sp.]|nr:SPOR domain-containing protein [Campylobacter sp.]